MIPIPIASPDNFVLPDLIGQSRFSLAIHPAAEEISAQSSQWFIDGCPELTEKQRRTIEQAKLGLLGPYGWPSADAKRLRVMSDFIVYLFHLDDIAEGLDGVEQLGDLVLNAIWFPDRYKPTKAPGKEQPEDEPSISRLTRDFWGRFSNEASLGFQARFKELPNNYLEAVNREVEHFHTGSVPKLESYIVLRRGTGACPLVIALIEYGMCINMPDHVIAHPTMQALANTTSDILSWENDILSYNTEQSRGVTHKLIAVLVHNLGCGLQEALDRAGDMCRQAEGHFCALEQQPPSWGPELDGHVKAYVQGMRDWLVGARHWNFVTTRYFGEAGQEAKESRRIKLLPKRSVRAD